MKHFTSNMNMGIQGDVCFTKVETLPENLVKVGATKGQLVVAHSETGHNHAFTDQDDVVLLQNPEGDGLSLFLQVNTTSDLVHHRSYDAHETVRFEPGIYRINRQREHTPEGWRRVED